MGDKQGTMSKEQRKPMVHRHTFIGTDPEQATEKSYIVLVSGGRVWIHRWWEEGNNEDGTRKDIGHDCWPMTVEDLKTLVKCANAAIQNSEAFEATHPLD